ncbi:hypothetical protein B296_00039177 [Ensete ventricosum]|uniref:Uncharacterized protein n=1 Tax=Ensete ventricosum TaxID=4639 RepID=A0A426X221_ENSVE|nr:hypothetical protein B296_00039177 [Ensete ventricosum]
MRTVLRSFKIKRGMIILFLKGCLSPLLAPSTPLSLPSLPLRRRRLPFAVGSRPAKGRPPLQPASSLLLAAGLAAGGSLLRVPRCQRLLPVVPVGVALAGCFPMGGCYPLQAGPGRPSSSLLSL